MDITKLQTVIAVQDASEIDVGDYLNVGDEMMYVESVDGNCIGVKRGAAGTTAAVHLSIPNGTADLNYGITVASTVDVFTFAVLQTRKSPQPSS